MTVVSGEGWCRVSKRGPERYHYYRRLRSLCGSSFLKPIVRRRFVKDVSVRRKCVECSELLALEVVA